MNAWQQFKESMKSEAKPWHLLSSAKYANEDLVEKRMNICLDCPELIHLTKQCKQCGCFMSLKTKLEISSCPLNKW